MASLGFQPQVEDKINHAKKITVPFTINTNATVGSITATIDASANLAAGVEIVVAAAAGAAVTGTGPITGFAYTALSSDTTTVKFGIGVSDSGAVRPLNAFGFVKSNAGGGPAAFSFMTCLDPTAATSGVVAPTGYTNLPATGPTNAGQGGGVAFYISFNVATLLTTGTGALKGFLFLEWE